MTNILAMAYNGLDKGQSVRTYKELWVWLKRLCARLKGKDAKGLMRRLRRVLTCAAAVLLAAGLLASAFLLRYKISLPGVMAAFASAGAEMSGAKSPSSAVQKDIVYKTVKGGDLKLDLYQPRKRLFTEAPAVFLIHGGGWDGGDKALDGGDWMEGILDYGLALVSVQYRLTDGDTHFPAHIEDCSDAVRFMALHASEYGLDKERFCVMGASAGGILRCCSPWPASGTPRSSSRTRPCP